MIAKKLMITFLGIFIALTVYYNAITNTVVIWYAPCRVTHTTAPAQHRKYVKYVLLVLLPMYVEKYG